MTTPVALPPAAGVPATSTQRKILLALTIIGFVVPNAMLARYAQKVGIAHAGKNFFSDAAATLPAAQLSADAGLTATSFLIWSFWDSRRHGVRGWSAVLIGTFSVGICFSAPLYLWLREGALHG